ncbi:uncharacterized protein, YigZ family [Caldanaerobius fijiensis DSM 17918]|uniref:Uncharacterized protein, YigZ family n=1 Tax=Caldanaerobius fijiensis DSM 17918 TaxID=1121256 RepID=A0A1M4TVB1_9THEO|nr:YigZ family protein [Caldanaerobius fijiensis]SHE48390.1 uncharacterized protein, YigZ family [Caldanaerobius fijiensis DSM 17918]
MLSEFITVKDEGSAEIIINKSRFIGYAKYTPDEKSAHLFINNIKERHNDATHNVYAYILGDSGEIQRFSDDGEPSGTAGMPVLEVIKREQLIYVTVVVTRYFGGILLGAGGLIRAYSKGAKIAIDAAGIVKKVLHAIVKIKIDYTSLGKIQNYLSKQGLRVVDIQYSETVDLIIAVPHDKINYVNHAIMDMTYGKAKIDITGYEYYEME